MQVYVGNLTSGLVTEEVSCVSELVMVSVMRAGICGQFNSRLGDGGGLAAAVQHNHAGCVPRPDAAGNRCGGQRVDALRGTLRICGVAQLGDG